MKLFILEKKKIGIFIIIIGLVMVLVGVEKHFDENLKSTSLLQNDIKSLKEYEILDNKISFKLPSEWCTEEEKFMEDEIIYSSSFFSDKGEIHGSIQVLNLSENLINLIKENKKNSEGEKLIKDYQITRINYDESNGYRVKYDLIQSKNTKYKVYEYYIDGKSCVIKFSFWVKKKEFKENMPTNFEIILKSLKIKN